MATCIEFEGKKYTIEEFKNLLSDVKLDESKQSQIKPGIEELFESNPELANEVDETLEGVQDGTSEQGEYENSILYKARNGDKEAQQRMQDFGLEWDEKPVKHRQIGEKEAEKLLNGEHIKPERNGRYVDISDFPA
ncbi:MAG: hypothetical protein WCR47_04525, partial [Desulfoplanes sp.]